MNDRKFAKQIGEAGRQTAIELFGKEKIKKQWDKFFKEITNNYKKNV